MNKTTNTNALYISVSSLGLFTADGLKDLISSSETATSSLGGRLVKIGDQSFLIYPLAREILKQNSSPTVCDTLDKLCASSNRTTENSFPLLRIAAAFRDGLMWLCGTNSTVTKKLREAHPAIAEMKAIKAKEIDQRTQKSLSLQGQVKPSSPIKQPTSKPEYTPLEQGESKAQRKRLKELSERKEELELLKQESKLAKQKIDSLKKRISLKGLSSQGEKALLEEVIMSLQKKDIGSQLEQDLLKEISLLQKILENEAFLQETERKITALMEIERFEKEFDETLVSNGSSFTTESSE